MKRRCIVVSALLQLTVVWAAHAQWQPDGVRLGGAAYSNAVCSDGLGGTLVAWQGDAGTEIVQRVDGSGVPLWGPDGVIVCNASGERYRPAVAPDGSGGAFVTWLDGRDGDNAVYVQYVDESGAPVWAVNGIAISPLTIAPADHVPDIISDRGGGVYVAWDDYRNGDYDVFAQHLNPSGATSWTPGGLLVENSPSDQTRPKIALSAVGRLMVCYVDSGAGLIAQSFDSGGNPQWNGAAGLLLGFAADSYYPAMVTDGAGGAIVTWVDASLDIRAQRIGFIGSPLWTLGGVPVCATPGVQSFPTLSFVSGGGADIVWSDERGGSPAVYVQRLNGSGNPQWPMNGIRISSALLEDGDQAVLSDGSGTYIVYSEYGLSPSADIHVQKLDSGGTAQWGSHGKLVCAQDGDQILPCVAPGASGGLIATWLDNRSGWVQEMYAQRITSAGVDDEFTVTKTNDDGSPGSLRFAIERANAVSGAQAIRFNIPGTGVHTIQISSDLPIVTETLIIDGFTQPGASPNTTPVGNASDAHLMIEINGGQFASLRGFQLAAPDCTLRGVSMFGIYIPVTATASNAVIEGNYFGFRADGQPFPSNNGDGVIVLGDNCRVGGATAAARNVIGGFRSGVYVYGVTGAQIYGNYIGIDPGLAVAQLNSIGIWLLNGANGAKIGSSALTLTPNSEESNVIRNNLDGVVIQDAGTVNNMVIGNSIMASPGSGIDLGYDGPTYNDRNDADTGPNNKQNQPVLTSVSATQIDGFTSGIINQTVQIHFYRSTLCGGSDGRGNAMTYIGGVTVGGLPNFSFHPARPLPAGGNKITCTATDLNGNTSELTSCVVVVSGIDDTPVPAHFNLAANVPNPFNPVTTIRYDVPRGGADVNITIYDIAGRRVRELVNEHRAPGTWSVEWNGEEGRGGRVASGVYFYRMRAGGFVDTKKMVLLK